MTSSQRFVVSADDCGTRADLVIARRLQHLSRRRAAQLCESGQVRVDGRRVGKSALLAAGSQVEVASSADGTARPAPEISLNIVLEREDLLIVDKPAGIPCAALPGREEGTLAGALLARYPELAEIGYEGPSGSGRRDPGLLHRLDTYTSGLVLVARSARSFQSLRAELKAGRIEKKYWALVLPERLPEVISCAAALAPDPRDAKRVVVSARGRPSQSEFRVLTRSPRFDLVEVSAPVAYRHQVRVHAAELGAPLAGDALYGDFRSDLRPRHALHACAIRGSAPGIAPFAAFAELPADLAALLE